MRCKRFVGFFRYGKFGTYGMFKHDQPLDIEFLPVNHRPRTAGKSKYGIGNRLWVGMTDLLGTRWLLSRRFRMTAVERLKLGDE